MGLTFKDVIILGIVGLLVISCSGFQRYNPEKDGIVGVEITPKDSWTPETYKIKTELDILFNKNQSEYPYKIVISSERKASLSGISSSAFSTNTNVIVSVKYDLFYLDKKIYSSYSSVDGNYSSIQDKMLSEYSSQNTVAQNASEIIAKKIYLDINSAYLSGTLDEASKNQANNTDVQN